MLSSGLTYRETAQRLGIKEGTVAKWVSDERESVRQLNKRLSDVFPGSSELPADARKALNPQFINVARRRFERSEATEADLSARMTRARSSAVRTMARAASGKKVDATALRAAESILKRMPLENTEKLSVLSASKETDLAERALFCAVSLCGLQGVRDILLDLERSGQLGGVQLAGGETEVPQVVGSPETRDLERSGQENVVISSVS